MKGVRQGAPDSLREGTPRGSLQSGAALIGLPTDSQTALRPVCQSAARHRANPGGTRGRVLSDLCLLGSRCQIKPYSTGCSLSRPRLMTAAQCPSPPQECYRGNNQYTRHTHTHTHTHAHTQDVFWPSAASNGQNDDGENWHGNDVLDVNQPLFGAFGND